MKHTLLIKEEAGHEIADAYKWYDDKRQGLGDEFLTELNEYFALLESDPLYARFVIKTTDSYR